MTFDYCRRLNLLVFLLGYFCVSGICEEVCPFHPPVPAVRKGRCASDDASKSGRIAVAFFGISRSLNITLPFIERHVFEVLDRSNIIYDVFWHTVSTSSVHNPHSNERRVEINEYDAMLMRPCRVSIVDEDVLAAQEFDKYCRTKKMKCSKSKYFDNDPLNAEKYDAGLWSGTFAETKNRLNSLASQREVYAMIREHAIQYALQYDGIIALRPDMAPITDTDLPLYIHRLRDPDFADNVWVPDYQPFRGYNDRSAWGSTGGMAVYLQRGKEYRDMPSEPTLHSERFLKAYLDHKGITVHETSSYRSVRVRADGCVDRMDTWHMNFADEERKAWLSSCFKEMEVTSNQNKCAVLKIGTGEC